MNTANLAKEIKVQVDLFHDYPVYRLIQHTAKKLSPVRSQLNGISWYSPNTLQELYQLMNTNSGNLIKLVVGNTSGLLMEIIASLILKSIYPVGIFKDDPSNVLIDISNIPDLTLVFIIFVNCIF